MRWGCPEPGTRRGRRAAPTLGAPAGGCRRRVASGVCQATAAEVAPLAAGGARQTGEFRGRSLATREADHPWVLFFVVVWGFGCLFSVLYS